MSTSMRTSTGGRSSRLTAHARWLISEHQWTSRVTRSLSAPLLTRVTLAGSQFTSGPVKPGTSGRLSTVPIGVLERLSPSAVIVLVIVSRLASQVQMWVTAPSDAPSSWILGHRVTRSCTRRIRRVSGPSSAGWYRVMATCRRPGSCEVRRTSAARAWRMSRFTSTWGAPSTLCRLAKPDIIMSRTCQRSESSPVPG